MKWISKIWYMHGILFSNLKLLIDATMLTPKHYAMRKPVTKDYVFHDSVYMKFKKQPQKAYQWLPRIASGSEN